MLLVSRNSFSNDSRVDYSPYLAIKSARRLGYTPAKYYFSSLKEGRFAGLWVNILPIIFYHSWCSYLGIGALWLGLENLPTSFSKSFFFLTCSNIYLPVSI